MAFELEHVCHQYNPHTSFSVDALKDISFSIKDGEFVGIIGHTGSGKSTLIQHLNGLLKPTSGKIFYNGQSLEDKSMDMHDVRTQVGMVFQYPEHQLFETTVFEDVKFGPKNQGLSDKEATLRAYDALEQVHFPEELFYQSPFDLSGGQKRLCAIAGVLAMNPLTLILDEPTAGLDPNGRAELLSLIQNLHKTSRRTIILVSHSMEDIAEYVERLIVLNKGTVAFDDSPKEVFSHYKELEQMGLSAPEITYFMKALANEGFSVDTSVVTIDEAVQAIMEVL